MSFFTRPMETQTIPRQTPSLTQQTEARFTQVVQELAASMRELADASAAVKSGVPSLLAKREHALQKFHTLLREHSRLKAELQEGFHA